MHVKVLIIYYYGALGSTYALTDGPVSATAISLQTLIKYLRFWLANLRSQAFIFITSFLKGWKDVIDFKGEMLLFTTELQLNAVGTFLVLA